MVQGLLIKGIGARCLQNLTLLFLRVPLSLYLFTKPSRLCPHRVLKEAHLRQGKPLVYRSKLGRKSQPRSGGLYTHTLPYEKRKKGKNNLSRPPQNKNPLYLVVRIIKLNYCHSEKGANTSEKVCVWSNSCQGAQYPDTDEGGQVC